MWWTTIGPPIDPGADYSPGTIPVVGQLAPDGSATWWRLPDGWSVAASDVGGTILTRRDGDQLQLATLGTRSVPPATDDPAAALAEAIGASSTRRACCWSDAVCTATARPPR